MVSNTENTRYMVFRRPYLNTPLCKIRLGRAADEAFVEPDQISQQERVADGNG